GIRKHFQCTVCCEDTRLHKPDPDPYLRACELLGVEPTESLALEDSALGITAAKAAGMSAVAVPTAMTGYQTFGHADLVLGSLDEMALGQMLRKLDAGRAQP
ncbi:MAG: HAD-IA family hydrolase, partial [Phycisphaerales bacterium]